MTDRTISLRADLVERLETLASDEGRSLDDVLGDSLQLYAATSGSNWASALAQAMEEADDIEWKNEPDLSLRSREHFEEYAHQKWLRTQGLNSEDNV